MSQMDSNYQPPQSNEPLEPKKVSVLIVIIAIVLTAIGVILGYAFGQFKNLAADGRIGELIGVSLAPIFVALLIVAFFQLFKRFRNQRSRWKIYCWGALFGAFISISNFSQAIAADVSGNALEDFQLSGFYCHEVEVGSLESCLCYNFEESGVLEFSGRTSYGKSSVVVGTYERVDNNITTSLENAEGARTTEVMTLATLNSIKTEDELIFRKMSIQPALCTTR